MKRSKNGIKSDVLWSFIENEFLMNIEFIFTGVTIPDTAAEDSVSLLPLLKGETVDGSLHDAVISHSAFGVFRLFEC